MVYTPIHKRKTLGKPIHMDYDTKSRLEKKRKKLEYEKEFDVKKIEAKYLVPKLECWIETPAVKKIKERVKMWLSLGYPVHIIGPTGCGKTAVAIKVAEELDKPVVWINGDESITTTDLIGGYSQVEVEAVRDKYIHNVFKDKDILKADWIDNPLTLACKHGYTLVYNEFSRTKPAANNILLGVFEEGILELPTKFSEERYIKVHPSFNVIFTSNSVEYAGVHRPQDALLDRIVGVYMDFYDDETEAKIAVAHSGISLEQAREIVEKVRKIRQKFPEAERPGTRACIMVAKALKAFGYTKENFESACMDIMASKIKNSDDILARNKLVREIK